MVLFQLMMACMFLFFTNYSAKADANVTGNGVTKDLGGGAGRVEIDHLIRNVTFQVNF